ncbi:hypothetical protein SAY86_029491 [Trapa natans]|uniref:RIN4 pathogenic type III effector avirulence factor Avr cleavage site domain-containing protein n=1 Tax=Trapa natans TaxID=22666 RepID=A0AAN7RD19_TRANT|nr:hypothetical protein SAY86_029491 [Trapa natans]
MSDKGQPLPKFGEWDVNDPTSAEGFTAIFNKARDEKKTGGKTESPGKGDTLTRNSADSGKPPKGMDSTGLCLVKFDMTIIDNVTIPLMLQLKNGFAAFRARSRCWRGAMDLQETPLHPLFFRGFRNSLLKDKGA